MTLFARAAVGCVLGNHSRGCFVGVLCNVFLGIQVVEADDISAVAAADALLEGDAQCLPRLGGYADGVAGAVVIGEIAAGNQPFVKHRAGQPLHKLRVDDLVEQLSKQVDRYGRVAVLRA